MDGVVEFYENYQANGFMEVGTPVRVLNFTNKELDRDLELNYFGARYYQPEFPRFLSPDPVGGTPEVPISWNRYLYCRNDPINLIDPDGNKEKPYVEGQDTAYIGNEAAMKLETATPMKLDGSWNPDAYNCFSMSLHSSQGDPTDPANQTSMKLGITKWDNNADDDVAENMLLDADAPNKIGDVNLKYHDSNGDGKWTPGEKIYHASTVARVDDQGNTLEVTAKIGQGGITTNHPSAPDYYEFQTTERMTINLSSQHIRPPEEE